MIKLKVSYETSDELQKLIKLLKPYIISCKNKQKTGRFYRTYIALDVKKC